MAKKEVKKKVVKKPKRKYKEQTNSSLAYIIKAIKSKPMTRESIVKMICKEFPTRNSQSVKRTVQAWVPFRLNNWKNLNVKQDEKGRYYIK